MNNKVIVSVLKHTKKRLSMKRLKYVTYYGIILEKAVLSRYKKKHCAVFKFIPDYEVTIENNCKKDIEKSMMYLMVTGKDCAFFYRGNVEPNKKYFIYGCERFLNEGDIEIDIAAEKIIDMHACYNHVCGEIR